MENVSNQTSKNWVLIKVYTVRDCLIWSDNGEQDFANTLSYILQIFPNWHSKDKLYGIQTEVYLIQWT